MNSSLNRLPVWPKMVILMNKRLDKIWRQAAFCVCLAVLLFSAACAPIGQSSYPEISRDEEIPGNTQTEPVGNDWQLEPTRLVLAVPFGPEAAEMLRLLFLARLSGDLPLDRENLSGNVWQQEDLLVFDQPLELVLESVSWAEGADREQMDIWRSAGELPDIIYSRNASTEISKKSIIDLTDHLAENSLLSPDNIYASMLEGAYVNNGIYGIPFLASTPLLLSDREWLTQAGVSLPAAAWSWLDFAELALAAQAGLDESGLGVSQTVLDSLQEEPQQLSEILTRCRLTLANPQELFRWLPLQTAGTAGGYGWQNGSFDLTGDAWQATYAWLEQFISSGLTPYHLSGEQRQEAMLQNRIQIARRSVFWIADSTELAWWHQQDGISVSEKYLPIGELFWPLADNEAENGISTETAAKAAAGARFPVNMRYLAVAAGSDRQQLATGFAAFIALDPDSLLIQSRYQLYEGMFPASRNDEVWQAMVSRQPYSSMLMSLRPELDNIYVEPVFSQANWVPATTEAQALLLALLQGQEDEEPDTEVRLGEINRRINRLLRGE